MVVYSTEQEINELCKAIRRGYVGIEKTERVRRILTNIRIIEGYHAHRERRMQRYQQIKALPIVGSALSVIIDPIVRREKQEEQQVKERLFLALRHQQLNEVVRRTGEKACSTD